MLVPRYKLSLCHTPIKPDLVGFPGIGVFACEFLDRVFKRFASIAVLESTNLSSKTVHVAPSSCTISPRKLFKTRGCRIFIVELRTPDVEQPSSLKSELRTSDVERHSHHSQNPYSV